MPTTPRRHGIFQEPLSPVVAAVVFASAFAVFQPAMQWLMHIELRTPLPAAGPSGWVQYTAAVAGLGAAVGVAWQVSRARSRSRWAVWAGRAAQCVAMAALYGGQYFGAMALVQWYATVLVTAAMVAGLIGWLGRMLGPVVSP